MKVFVLNRRGKPLMPTTPRKARKLLESGKAKVVRRTPFTIQLTIATGETKQDIVLGVDTGYKNVGLSAVSGDNELFAAEVKLRTDISGLLTEKSQYRRQRRNRLWYRKPRFNNRGNTRKEGRLMPSIQHKLESHVKAVNFVSSILPVSQVIIETAAFDIQKIKNPDISGTGYQDGEQAGFWNVREYVLYRDGHVCRACKGKSGDKILNVHHVKPRAEDGTDRPDNLITLCESCHTAYHKGKLVLKVRPSAEFKAETFMSVVRWKIADALRNLGYSVSHTYGYLTKSARIDLKLPKSHANDAFCIAGGSGQERADAIGGSFTRRNNRSVQLNRKGFKPSIRRKRYPLQPGDAVRFGCKVLSVVGVHSYGKAVKLRNGVKDIINANVKKVELICYGKGLKFNYAASYPHT